MMGHGFCLIGSHTRLLHVDGVFVPNTTGGPGITWVIAWLNGYTNVLNVSPTTTSGVFFAEANFKLPGAGIHQAKR
jgi:hypothetical protein